MTLSRNRLLSKIHKLLALAGSHHPHEAAAAMAKAQQLMDAHGVDEAEVATADVERQWASRSGEPKVPSAWLAELAVTVGKAFGTRPQWAGRVGFCYIGLSPATDLSVYTLTVLRRKLTKARSVYYRSLRGKRTNRIRKADDYALGWVWSVRDEVERFARPVPEVVTAYLDRQSDTVACKPRDRGRDMDRRHLVAGFVDGADVDLQHGMDAAAGPLTLSS